jgi:hypothetical protein
MVEYGGWHSWGADERKLVDVEVDRQIHFAVGPFDVRGQKLCLQIHQLMIVTDFAGAHVAGVQVGHITMAVCVTGFPNVFSMGIDESHV